VSLKINIYEIERMSLATPTVDLTDLHLNGAVQNVLAARGDKLHLVRLKDGDYEGGELVMDTDAHNYQNNTSSETKINFATIPVVSSRPLNPAQGSVIINGSTLEIWTIENGWTSSVSGNMTDHIIPDTNAAYDIGSADYKIRHLFLSDNSLSFGDKHFGRSDIENMLQTVQNPSASNSPGKKGDISFTDNFCYVCIEENKWKRFELSDW
jgi:hypothetical protein